MSDIYTDNREYRKALKKRIAEIHGKLYELKRFKFDESEMDKSVKKIIENLEKEALQKQKELDNV